MGRIWLCPLDRSTGRLKPFVVRRAEAAASGCSNVQIRANRSDRSNPVRERSEALTSVEQKEAVLAQLPRWITKRVL
jgi:hypothetical protein